MKKVLMVVVVVFGVLMAHAQDKKVVFSLGGGVSSLTNLGAKSIIGFGIDAQATTNFTESIQGFAQTGYHSFSQDGTSGGFIPFLVGAKYIAGDFRPGIGIGYGTFSGSGGSVFSPQVGYNVNKFDIIAHYTSTSIAGGNVNVIGLKVLYQLF